jgi:RNA polymerase-binding transcription factor DksA
MATKKKPAPKKASKPVKKATKKAAPKKPAAKAAPKKTAKPIVKKASPQKPVAKAAAKKPVEKPAKPIEKKAPGHENKSLVSVKPQIKPIVKKEPPKPVKVVIPKTNTKSIKKYEPEFTKSVLDAQEQDASAPSQRYSDPELLEFKEIIQKKLDAAKKELNYLQGLITRKDESGDMDEGRYMTMEDGSVSMEREQLSQMASRQITFIDHLEKALMRIENKTYGICRVTGKLIDKARLRAVPHATLSIEAKQMMNK